MKANELMIGDWVVGCSGEPFKIGIIDPDFLHWNEIQPIPLTPEILEKNGFRKFPFLHIEGQHQWTWWENILISVTLWCRELNDDTKDGMMLKIEAQTYTLCIKVNYVHELQHAFRLCKIHKEIEL